VSLKDSPAWLVYAYYFGYDDELNLHGNIPDSIMLEAKGNSTFAIQDGS